MPRAAFPFLRADLGRTAAVGPDAELKLPRLLPIEVTRPRAFPVAGFRPVGNGLLSVPGNVRPLSLDARKVVVGVNPVCTRGAVIPESWNGAVKMPKPPRMTVLLLRAYETPTRGWMLFLSAACCGARGLSANTRPPFRF